MRNNWFILGANFLMPWDFDADVMSYFELCSAQLSNQVLQKLGSALTFYWLKIEALSENRSGSDLAFLTMEVIQTTQLTKLDLVYSSFETSSNFKDSFESIHLNHYFGEGKGHGWHGMLHSIITSYKKLETSSYARTQSWQMAAFCYPTFWKQILL